MNFRIYVFLLVLILSSCRERANCHFMNAETSFFEGITGTYDLEEAIRCSESSKKPLFLFFSGYACVSDRSFEERIASNESILTLLSDEFVCCFLMVDDKTQLPKERQSNVNFNGKRVHVNTVGKKNAIYQAQKFQTNTQPFIALLSYDGKEVYSDMNFTTAENEFLPLLREAISLNMKYLSDKSF